MMDRGTELALKRAVREGLATRLQGDFDPVEVESVIQSLVQEAVRAWSLGLAEPDVARLCRSVGDDFLRYGPLQGLLEDPGITEIIVNGGGVAMDAGVARILEPHVFVERAGRLEPCPYVRFDDADHLRRIIDKIAELGIEPSEQVMFICHADCEVEARAVAEEMKARYGVKEVYINYIGPVIGSHTGPNTMGIFFVGTKR